MDYNYLKTLPKDILIKIITEIEEKTKQECKMKEESERKDWYEDCLFGNGLDVCSYKDCFRIIFSTDYSYYCESCDIFMCNSCYDEKIIECYECKENTLCTSCGHCSECF